MSKIEAVINQAEASTNKIFGLKKIGQKDDRPFTVKLGVPWYFDTGLSKGFLIFLLLMTIYAIVRIIFQGFW